MLYGCLNILMIVKLFKFFENIYALTLTLLRFYQYSIKIFVKHKEKKWDHNYTASNVV